MPYNRELWSSSGEHNAFNRLVFWNGENKDEHFIINRTDYPEGFFDAEQAYIKIGWYKNNSRTMTSLMRHLHKWASEGMMEERSHWDPWRARMTTIYRWID